MIGGRILGQGTYGCVFQPALTCRGKGKSKRKDEHMVGKITSKDDAKNELEISNYFKKIPEYNKYVIVSESGKCHPRSKSKQVDPDIQHCEYLEETHLEDTVQLRMPWGGYSMNYINLDPYVFNYFRFIEEILEIGTFLVLNDICHFDIWGENFLFDKQYHPKLIDFGMTFRPSKLQLSMFPNRWRQFDVSHDTETPEVTLMIGVHSRKIPVEEIIKGLQREKPAVQNLVAFCDIDATHWSNELYQWTKESNSFKEHDWLTCWKTYWPGFDAWSIGAVFLNILQVQLANPSFVNSSLWTTKGNLIKDVLKGLCRGHPGYRLDAVEALNLLTNGIHPFFSSGSAGSEWIRAKERLNNPPSA